MEGWTDYNRQLDKVYDSFFSSIRQTGSNKFQQSASALKSTSSLGSSPDQNTTTSMSPSDRIKEVNQLVLDAKSELDTTT